VFYFEREFPLNTPILSIRDKSAIALAVKLIADGELVIVPTDTIYGIVTLPDKKSSIDRLYEVRNREPEPALPLLIASFDLIKKYAEPNSTALQLAQRFWPGPLTLILPSSTYSTPVALRVPNFPLLQPLFKALGGCLFASGAILSGHSPAITAPEARVLFGNQVALILDGGLSPYGLPSTIVDCTRHPPLLVRRGATSGDKIKDVLGDNSFTTTRFQQL
jgi:L-threonylcarbamoyladenylate synthase